MSQLLLLDCTLRDGGYVNDWRFPQEQIISTIHKLADAGIDFVECGYITSQKTRSEDSSQFHSVDVVEPFLPAERGRTQYVAMVNYGEMELSDIPPHRPNGIDGIRVAFHKKDRYEALRYSQRLIEKGYMVFFQPMVTLNYTDEEFLDMLQRANEINPAAFYIVDSFGSMRQDDLLHLFYLADFNLRKDIMLGFHSHNNLQLSYSHAQLLATHLTERTIVIDSSIMGMGRGAGNLNTELFADYLNRMHGKSYQIKALLQIMDAVISPIYHKKYWGYSLPHYLSATHNCHPNYASYLDNMNTLTYRDVDEIFRMMMPEKKAAFDGAYIQALYTEYQSRKSTKSNYDKLNAGVKNRPVLILAPGASLADERERVVEFIREHEPVTVSVNFIPRDIPSDFIFVSNIRRWENLGNCDPEKLILTSNIKTDKDVGFVVNYTELLNDQDAVKDNSAMMLILLMIKLGASHLYLAGLDGYGTGGQPNFVEDSLEFNRDRGVMEAMNRGMEAVLGQLSKDISIRFVTTPRYVDLS